MQNSPEYSACLLSLVNKQTFFIHSLNLNYMKTTNIFYRTLCLVLMALSSISVFGQQGQTDPLQFYSPNTYAFARYGDLPVNYSRGLPQIDIPLMSISDKDLNLDISLSYHAAGIKVDQEAGWVGLGWSLNAGGMITGQVRGVPDFKGTNGATRTSLNFYDNSYEDFSDYIEQEWSALYQAANNGTDNAPDIFYYNFCGKSGKFYLDENRQGRMLDQEDLKIEFLSDNTFRIVDERGVIYTFASTESAYNNSFGGYYTTGWYLSEMTSPSGGRLSFEYVSGGLLSAESFGRAYTSCFIELLEYTNTHEIGSNYHIPIFTTGEAAHGLVLSRITASDGSSVGLNQRSGKRLDARNVNGSVLETLSLRNPSGRICKEYRFTYSYFEPDASHRLGLSGYDFLNYRLRLDKVSEMIPGSTHSVGSYTFSYYGDGVTGTDNVYALPYRLSPCQDHWGYYNHTDNLTIFPGNDSATPFHKDYWYTWLNPDMTQGYDGIGYEITNGGDRSRHGEAVKACTLKKITYPTGGSTEFEFEPHDVNFTSDEVGMGGIRVSKIIDRDASGNTRTRTYSYGYYSWEFGKCAFQTNLYHLYFKQNIHDDGTGQAADLLLAYGVPPQHMNAEHLLMINSIPSISLGLEADFMYPNVTEYVQGQGRTEYTFRYNFNFVPGNNDLDGLTAPHWGESSYVYKTSTIFVDDTYFTRDFGNGLSCEFPYMSVPDLGWKRGQLLNRKVYSESGSLMESETMTYEDRFLHVAPGYKVFGMGGGTTNEILFGCDYVASGRTRPTSRTHTVYGDNGEYTVVENYSYTDNGHRLVSRTASTDSRGDSLIVCKRYTCDYGNPLSGLITAHILHPVDVRTYRNGILAEGVQTQYNTSGQPVILYRSENGDIPFSGSTPYTFTPCEWYGYDTASGRLNSVTTRSGNGKAAYLWAYGSTYPVVKVEGADYGEVEGWLGTSTVNSLKTATGSSVASKLEDIRSTLSAKDVQVTTYTYIPGVGMESMTAPNGNVTYYEYDGCSRLVRIGDNDNKTVETYGYHWVTGQSFSPTVVAFSNVNSGNGHVSADIVCEGTCEVTIQLDGNLSSTGSCVEYYLDGNFYTYSQPYSLSTTLTLTAGTHTFEAYLYNTSSSDEYAAITITAVDSPNTLGSNLNIQVQH